MENFVYETPTKVYFGKEEELNVGKIIAGYAPKKVLVHFGGQSARKSGLLDRVEKALEAEGIAYVELGGVTANPELKLVREGIALCQREGVDFVLAVGGGSVLDSSKDIANGVANPDIDVWDFFPWKMCTAENIAKRCDSDTGSSRFGNVKFLRDYKCRNKRKTRLWMQLQPYGFCY